MPWASSSIVATILVISYCENRSRGDSRVYGGYRSGGDRNKVQTGIGALELELEPGSPEQDRLVSEFVRGGYLTPHPNQLTIKVIALVLC